MTEENPTNENFEEVIQKTHVTYLQRVNQQASQMIKTTLAESNLHAEQLHWERVAHIQTQQELEIERRLHQEAASTVARLERELLVSKTACSAIQRALSLEKATAEEMAAELDRTQRKFHLVDMLVDTMLLEEDSQLKISDRSRQITDVILDLERQMEERYRTKLQEKDEQISRLERQSP
ncbi:uncharacterized protein BJX67DRAFT_372815 [Aspergillus lucknowensis]|uniref:Uncharacterized protein n=1 Tax=Aspergillus lucknowensis TaxID=176173 RepID=A0ABR4LPX4_9EURO